MPVDRELCEADVTLLLRWYPVSMTNSFSVHPFSAGMLR